MAEPSSREQNPKREESDQPLPIYWLLIAVASVVGIAMGMTLSQHRAVPPVDLPPLHEGKMPYDGSPPT